MGPVYVYETDSRIHGLVPIFLFQKRQKHFFFSINHVHVHECRAMSDHSDSDVELMEQGKFVFFSNSVVNS